MKTKSAHDHANAFVRRRKLDPKSTAGAYAGFGYLHGYQAAIRQVARAIRRAGR